MKKTSTTEVVILFAMVILDHGLSLNNSEDGKRKDVKRGIRKEDHSRAEKRNLYQFSNMIKCATGKSGWDYNNYGNYCGWGGEGEPVDGVDRCCKVHDKCYGDNDHCWPKFESYHYKRSGNYPNCKITECNSNNNNKCEKDICNCDKVAAECFADNPYHEKNKHSGLF